MNLYKKYGFIPNGAEDNTRIEMEIPESEERTYSRIETKLFRNAANREATRRWQLRDKIREFESLGDTKTVDALTGKTQRDAKRAVEGFDKMRKAGGGKNLPDSAWRAYDNVVDAHWEKAMQADKTRGKALREARAKNKIATPQVGSVKDRLAAAKLDPQKMAKLEAIKKRNQAKAATPILTKPVTTPGPTPSAITTPKIPGATPKKVKAPYVAPGMGKAGKLITRGKKALGLAGLAATAIAAGSILSREKKSGKEMNQYKGFD